VGPGAEALRFDHGVQYLTVRDERFARWARSFFATGVLARWEPRLPAPPATEAVWLVGAPGMSALVSHLLQGLDARFEVDVARVERDGGLWALEDGGGARLGEYDALVLAVPAPRAGALLEVADRAMAERLRAVALAPCWAAMAAFEAPLEVPWDAAPDPAPALRWAARESSKPGRAPGERWVLHASTAWTERHLELEPADAAARLLAAFFAATGAAPAPPTALVGHRWRHATTLRPLGEDCLAAARGDLVACGDWCLDGRLEGAFLSGVAAAGRLLGQPVTPAPEGRPPPARRPSQLRLLD
jgi:predicted NAD/FAD-dependent oxidoreductase